MTDLFSSFYLGSIVVSAAHTSWLKIAFYTTRIPIPRRLQRTSSLGEALTRFLLTQAIDRPQTIVKIYGSNTETRRVVRRRENGETAITSEEETETVVDFNFSTRRAPYHYTLGDSEPEYDRGKWFTKSIAMPMGTSFRVTHLGVQ